MAAAEGKTTGTGSDVGMLNIRRLRPTKEQTPRAAEHLSEPPAEHFVTAGQVITASAGFMRGHGTYIADEKLYAAVSGTVERINKLVSVRTLKTRYVGEVGDVVIGRVVELGTKRWVVAVNSKLNAFLPLSGVNLPGGELRRRCEEDERAMRAYLQEGDLISAEVQQVYQDGSICLHTRSLKYGKLGQGVFMSVSPALVRRRKNHFHTLPCGASLILGNNGYVWISPTMDDTDPALGGDSELAGGFTQNLEPIPTSEREVIARLRNCVRALADNHMSLYDTSVLYAYEISLQHAADVRTLLLPEVASQVAELTRQRLDVS